jgi:arginyl-tRNA synthetase
MSNAVGESISRLIENGGAKVKRATYGGDVGLHVAKGIWGLLHEKRQKQEADIVYLGRAYVVGSEKYETDESAKKEIQEINKKVFEQSDTEINKLHEWGKKVSLETFHQIYQKLDSHFDFEFFESEMAPMGMFLVEEFLAKGIFEKSEGAIVFKGEKYDLHTRVFVNSQGLPTYETKELGLNKKKHELYPFHRSIIVTANEQNDYFKVLLQVMTLVYPDIANRTRHISHGMLRFAEGKMSSRKGNIITGESLISDVEKLVEERIAERELSSIEKDEIKTKVAIAAIKYSILKQSPGSDIIFDPEKSLSFEGDSGPYLQYATVRAGSILQKAEKEGIEVKTQNIPLEISGIEKLLFRFPDIAKRATKEFAPQHIATYLIELAGAFNSYYANHQIVDAKDEYSSYKVALTQSFISVMKNGLHLLGIQVPEKM